MSIVKDFRKRTPAADVDALHAELREERHRGRVLTFAVVLTGLAALIAAVVAVDLSGGLNHSTAAIPMNGANGHMNGGNVSNMPMNGNVSNMPMNGIRGTGGTAGNASTAPGTSPVPVVSSTLGEFWIHPSMTSVPAGRVEFTAHNVGQVTHELMIERMPIAMDAPGQPNEDAAQGMIDDMGPGGTGKMTLSLKPGMYMLFCNVSGHFAAGQHTMLRVTGS